MSGAKNLFGISDFDDLSALEHSRFHIDAMRLFGLARVVIDNKLRHFQGIMSTTLTRPRM